MHVRHTGRLRHTGIHGDDHLIRCLREGADGALRIGHLMRNVGIAAPVDDDLAVKIIRLQEVELITEDSAVAPPVAHELDTDGIEEILGADGIHQRLHGGSGSGDGVGAAADEGGGPRAVLIDDGPCLLTDLPVGLFPADTLEVVSHFFHRVLETVPVFHEILAAASLAAAVAVGTGAGGIGAHIDDPVVLDFHLQTAGDGAEVAPCLFPFAHDKNLL